MTSPITGREPRLSANRASQRGYQRLLPRQIKSLLRVLPPDAIAPEAAAAMLHSDDFFVRYNAARLMAERGDRDSRLIMHEVFATGGAPTRASVARHLHHFSWFSAQPLLQQALEDDDERVREAAVYALCDVRGLSAYEVLVETLRDETDAIRAAAAWGLRNCQDAAAVPVLAAVLQARDPDVRIKALEVLSATNTPDAVPVVRQALNDADPDVVYNAVLSLIELCGDACLPELAGHIKQIHGPSLEPVLRGLFHATNYLHINLGEHSAAGLLMQALAGALTDNEPDARKAAVWALAWMHDPRADALLVEAFQREMDHAVQMHMLRVTASLMTAGPLLEAGRSSDHEAVRVLAEQLHAARASGALAAYDDTDVAHKPLSRAELTLGSRR